MDNRRLTLTIQPFFSDTQKIVNDIILINNDKMLNNEKKIAKTFTH